MATYEKTTFTNGTSPAINASELNKIGNGILEALNLAEGLSTRVESLENSIGSSGNIGSTVASSLKTITWDSTENKLTKTQNNGTVSDVVTASTLKSGLGITISDTTGTVPVNRGGTGATTVAGARNALGLGNTNGAVPVANGGTGATTLASNGVLYGNGTSAVGVKASANGALYATSANGTLNFGTLPIAQGGTGATSASAARNALGLGNTTGALPVANGGTGRTTLTGSNSLRSDLGFGTGAGALAVANGGTGATSFTANAILVGNGTGAIQAKTTTASKAVYTNSSGVVTFGTLPIAQGGTGCTTIAQVRESFDLETFNNIKYGTLKLAEIGTHSAANYGTSLPSTAEEGQLYFKYS